MPKGRKRKVEDEDVIRAAKGVNEPVFTPKEVADELDVSVETIRTRLSGFVEDDVLDYKRAGSGKVYWFIGH